MTNECEKCHEHCVDCKCREKMSIYPGLGITLTEPLVVSIDKEYFRKKFKEVFFEWKCELQHGIGEIQADEIISDLLNCM